MNQDKIGKFIAQCRKEKKMTQEQLASILGVTEKSISNWENGRNMPDLSLFKPLCEELDISINDLLSGEKISKDNYQEKLEENIVNTIVYTNKKVNDKNKLIGIILIIFGIILILTAMSIFPSESSWGAIYSIIGMIISCVGFSRFTIGHKQRILLHSMYIIIFSLLLFIIDFIGVIIVKQAPRFSYIKESIRNMIIYKAPFYNVYRINYDTINEYYIIDYKKEYTIDTVPNVPFNRNNTGIENIKKYKNKSIGNNSNIGNLIKFLPLSDYGYTFEIDSKDLGLTINYHLNDWYINENYYLEKSLVYNSVSIFTLIDNVKYINYNFRSKSYRVERSMVEKYYPNYNEIIKSEEKFNKYLENKINDNNFIDSIFNKILIVK